MKKFIQEFKDFAMRGSVVDLAIGVIVGAAFGKIVTSLVNDIVMPLVGMILGKVDFADLYINLSGTDYPTLAAAKAAGASTLNYGMFLNNILDFVIVAAVIFIVIKQINRFKKKTEPAVVDNKTCQYCKSEVPRSAVKCKFCTSAI